MCHFREFNDVTSMAGVDLSEECDNILASTFQAVRTVTSSCEDEPFLSSGSLKKKILNIGETISIIITSTVCILPNVLKHQSCPFAFFPGEQFGVTDLDPEVLKYISHATQNYMKNMLEKASRIAKERNCDFRVCLLCRSSDLYLYKSPFLDAGFCSSLM